MSDSHALMCIASAVLSAFVFLPKVLRRLRRGSGVVALLVYDILWP